MYERKIIVIFFIVFVAALIAQVFLIPRRNPGALARGMDAYYFLLGREPRSLGQRAPLNYQSKSRNFNIILITIDALRSDHLGCYGYERNTSPNIDKLAKEGVRFEQAIAAGGWTFESVPSILTGVYSPAHQILDSNNLLNPEVKIIAQILNVADYQCIFWSNHVPLKFLDVKKGFQKTYLMGRYKNLSVALNNHAFTTKIIHWLKSRHRRSPFFFYIHYFGSHVPYKSPAPYKYMYMHDKFRKKPGFIPISNFKNGTRQYEGMGKIPYAVAENNITDPNYYISQYDGAISYTDVQIGRLLHVLKELGMEDNTIIILIADHGEMLGEHGIYFNHCKGYEGNIKVPLIIRFPGLFPKGKVISRQVNLVDIAPTILEIAGITKPYYMQGESLLSFIKPFRRYSKKYSFSFDHLWHTLRMDDWKLIYNGDSHTWELYNLRNDPREEYNLAGKNVAEFEKLKKIFEDFNYKYSSSAVAIKSNITISKDDEETLKSLGYVQ